MNRLTFVQHQTDHLALCAVVAFDDLNIVVRRIIFDNQRTATTIGGFDLAYRKQRQKNNPDQRRRCYHCGSSSRQPQTGQRNQHQAASENVDRHRRTNVGNQQQHWQKRADDRAERGNGVQVARRFACAIAILDREANGERADHAEQRNRHRKECQHAQQRAKKHPYGTRIKRGQGPFQNRMRQQRNNRRKYARHRNDRTQQTEIRPLVRPAPTDGVARRQIQQRQTDDVGPNQLRCAEIGRKQARSRQLDAKCADATTKNQQH